MKKDKPVKPNFKKLIKIDFVGSGSDIILKKEPVVVDLNKIIYANELDWEGFGMITTLHLSTDKYITMQVEGNLKTVFEEGKIEDLF